jgi:hypothetical protein
MQKILSTSNFFKSPRFWIMVSLLLFAFIVGCNVGQPSSPSFAANANVPSFIQVSQTYMFDRITTGQVTEIRSDGWLVIMLVNPAERISYINPNSCSEILPLVK